MGNIKFEDFICKMQRLIDEARKQNAFHEFVESNDKNKHKGGIVKECFNEGNCSYKVNLAYLNEEQVKEIEGLVKKWNPELKESEDEKIRESIIENLKGNMCHTDGDYDLLNKQIAWLEKQGEYEIDCPQNHRDNNRPNGCIVLEDFNGGEGFYKLHLDYLNKKQVEEVEEMVKIWNDGLNASNENIKACIGMCLTDINEQRFKDYGTNLKECLAWLEKQGEKIIPKNVDEAALQYVDTCPVNGEITHDNITEPYWNNHSMINAYKAGWLENQGEQKQDPCDNCKDVMLNCHNFPCIKKIAFKQGKSVFEVINEEKVDNANKVEPKFKDGYVLNSPSHHLIWIYKDNEHYYACVNMNYVTENVATDGLISIPNDACTATKNEQTILFASMKDAGYEWGADKKELKKIEVEPAWSEEDKNLLKISVENLTELKDRFGKDYGRVGDCINWLKSIKDRCTWRPSDEQMEAFENFVRGIWESCYDSPYENKAKLLYSLLEQLKKLK